MFDCKPASAVVALEVSAEIAELKLASAPCALVASASIFDCKPASAVVALLISELKPDSSVDTLPLNPALISR